MKRTKSELLESVKKVLGDTITDDGVQLLEDISDTLDDSQGGSTKELEDKVKELENKVKETDDMWRKKYTDRFFNPDSDTINEPTPDEDQNEDDVDDNEPTQFSDLFTSGDE